MQKRIVLIAAIAAGVAFGANAADLTVAAGSPKTMTAADSAVLYGAVTVNDDLTLNGTGIAITNTSALSMMNGLSTLYLDENPIQDFSGLRMIKSLSTLGLNNTGLDDNGLYYLRGLSNLTALYVEDNPLITGEAVEELRSMLND